jgi:DNA-binding SARP family transcriptional activator/tetratricopeptide (TPR) repeat protein
MDFRILGPVEVSEAGQLLPLGAPKERALLATLLLRANQVVATDQLIDELWGEAPPHTARATLHTYVRRLRNVLQPQQRRETSQHIIVTKPPGYLLKVQPGQLDLQRFDELVEEAREALAANTPEQAASRLREALAMWRGPALADVASTSLRRIEAPRLEERRMAALEARIEADLVLGCQAELLGELSALVARYPLRERFQGQLMLALYRSGRQSEALETYRAVRQTMVEELGLEPGSELQRLHRAILTNEPALALPEGPPRSPDRSRGAVEVPRQLPPDLDDFIGRDEPLGRLRGLLERKRSVRATSVVVVVISGTAGIGKTALAVHAAHLARGRFPDGQLYASLRGVQARPSDPSDVLAGFLRALGVDGSAIPPTGEDREGLYRTRLAGRRVLVLLDDAADEAQVRPLLPGHPGAAVLITSRARLAGLEGARLVHLDVLDAEQAVELLARIAGPRRVAAEPDAAAAIAVACGGLPLAVRIAGARLAVRPHWPLARMAGLLADERGRLDELVHGDMEVRASLSLSYHGLGEAHRRLFRRLGLLAAPDVAAWVAGALLDSPVARAEAVLEDLVDGQLVDVAGWDVTGRPRYRLHDLLHAYARERAQSEEPVGQRQAALERVLGGWLALAEQADRRLSLGALPEHRDATPGWRLEQVVAEDLLGDPLAWLEAERAALLSAIQQASAPDPAAVTAGATGRLAEVSWRLTGALAEFLRLRSYRDDHQHACVLSLVATRRTNDRRGEAQMLSDLAQLLVDQDRFEEAMVLAEQARVLHREVGDRRGEAQDLLTAAAVHEVRGRFQEAVGDLQRGLELYREVGDEHGHAWVLHNLGRIHRQQGRLIEAASDLEQALAASRLVGDRRSEAMVLHDFGLVHQSLERSDEAVACLFQSLQICRELRDGLGEGFVLRALGEVRLQQDASEEAAAAFQQALEVFRRAGSRRGEVTVLHSLGELHHVQGHWQQAKACLDAALVIQRRLGLTPRTAMTLTTLARVQAATGDHAAARRSRREARRLSQSLRVSAPGDPAMTSHHVADGTPPDM